MPRLSRWFVRSALLYLVAGFTLGALILLHKGLQLHPTVWRLLPAHIELLIFGWTLQFIFGVGFWIFPRFGRSRGNVQLGWLAYALLNAGIWLVVLAPLLDWPASTLVAGRLALLLAVLAFVAHAWPRIKPFRVV